MTFDLTQPYSWGPNAHGAVLHIDKGAEFFAASQDKEYMALDVETDENDNFVGIACCFNQKDVFYFTSLDYVIKDVLKRVKIVGHNAEADISWLNYWGLEINVKNLVYDTMVASYVLCPTADSHKLKTLGYKFLGWNWPSYDDMTVSRKTVMVTKGKRHPVAVEKEVVTKTTLDRQPVEVVANYCGMDCLTTMALRDFFTMVMSHKQKEIFTVLELPIYQVLYNMKSRGIMLDTELLAKIEADLGEDLKSVRAKIQAIAQPYVAEIVAGLTENDLSEDWAKTGLNGLRKETSFNAGSWQQKRLLLKVMGIDVESTSKDSLAPHKDNEFVSALLEHSEINKLSGFIGNDYKKTGLKYKHKDGIVHATFSQVSKENDEGDEKGIGTGRLCAYDPNLMQIPSRSKRGKRLRHLFIARPGHIFLCADYSQADLRVWAHESNDPVMIRDFKAGIDAHTSTANVAGISRNEAKTVNLAIINSGTEYAISRKLGIPKEQALELVNSFWRSHPVSKAWQQSMIRDARSHMGVKNFMGWYTAIPEINTRNYKMASYWERFAMSCVIQGGTGALCKLAMLRLEELGFDILVQEHDAILVEVPLEKADAMEIDMQQVMESVYPEFRVPLKVDIKRGITWGACK